MFFCVWFFLLFGPLGTGWGANPYKSWPNGPRAEDDFFPIAVWLQSPRNAARYRSIGINMYVGLWKGPTEQQLAELRAAGMQVICRLNETGKRHLQDPTIVGWMHEDEPDNAQPLPTGKGYGPPVPPQKIIADYQAIKRIDASRPVLLNLGQGVAWDRWHGRGVRTGHPEDYPEYIKGCDIASFDIYPVVHPKREVAGKLWYVARGIERLIEWTGGRKVVWNCIECTRIKNPNAKPTPQQVRCEVWMSIIHGSMGLIYFVHQWQPHFDEAALLHDEPMLREVAKINRQITQLAPVLNSPTIKGQVRVTTDRPEIPVATMVKRYGRKLYIFAVVMRPGRTRARFEIAAVPSGTRVEVLGEGRQLTVRQGQFEDMFDLWAVHLYQIGLQKGR